MDYQGYKLLDKIMLVCRDDYSTATGENRVYQAYLVDPANSKQLESARGWATWTEYGPSYKTESGKWAREYEIKHDPVEFEFDNNGFILELLDCAGGSSQGGKLSFWNCLVKRDDTTFKIGINSDMLLDLLKNATFDKGICQSFLVFITQKGKVGMTTEGSETYKQCIADRELRKDLKKTAVSKFTFGDILKTPTIEEVYLGTITQYYKFDPGRNTEYCYRNIYYSDCTITKLAKPVTYHMFDTIYSRTKLSDFINSYDGSYYASPDFKKNCPKRTIDGKIELDQSEESFKKKLVDKFYDYESYKKHTNDCFICVDPDKLLYTFLGRRTFGFGFESFEIPEDIMNKIKAAGIKYVEE